MAHCVPHTDAFSTKARAPNQARPQFDRVVQEHGRLVWRCSVRRRVKGGSVWLQDSANLLRGAGVTFSRGLPGRLFELPAKRTCGLSVSSIEP